VGVALGLFIFVFVFTFLLPEEPNPLDLSTSVVLVCFLSSLPPLVMIGGFLYVRSYLKAHAAYEDLRSGKRPVLVSFFRLFLDFPFSAVVLFALLTGFALVAWGVGGWGPAVRTSLIQVTTPLPPVTAFLHSVVGGVDAPWPGWVGFVLSVLYTSVVFALVAAWFERGSQRWNYVASLFTEEDRPPSPYGYRWGTSPNELQPEPHEQVLLMQAERIGAACLPYLRVELSGPEWTQGPVMLDRCRGAVAVLERVFGENDQGLRAWQAEPFACDFIADWLLVHLNRLVERDRSSPDPKFDHPLGEAIGAVAAMLASGQSLPSRPTLTSRGAYHDPDRIRRLRDHLRYVFSIAAKRPALLIAACNAAERLGTPKDLQLLDEQTRHLDVQAGFTIPQTDRILQTRDRVLAREPLRSALIRKLLGRIEELGMERLPVPEGKPMQFRRKSDGAIMVLIVASSFCRGDDHAEETSPKRRVHLGSYLMDIEPVSQQSFEQWVKDQGGILRFERGFFPVQGLPDDLPQDHPYAIHVTWFAAQAYAQWAVKGGHIPTEAQWEKAARGDKDERRYPSGDAWTEECISPYGVHLCHILEWTQDAFDRLAYRKNPVVFDPRMEPSSQFWDEALRVVRGRNPETNPANYHLAHRLGMKPITDAFAAPVGFRVAVDLEQEPST
jgi:formylglycine-generating enzyme required for sulfatase activity